MQTSLLCGKTIIDICIQKNQYKITGGLEKKPLEFKGNSIMLESYISFNESSYPFLLCDIPKQLTTYDHFTFYTTNF